MRTSTWVIFFFFCAGLAVLVINRLMPPQALLPVFGGGCLALLCYNEVRKPIPDAVIWRHPDNGGGIDLNVRPHLKHQRAHPCPYAWFGLKKIPLYFWYENKIEATVNPADLPSAPAAAVTGDTCICGFHPTGNSAAKLLAAHMTWNPRRTSLSNDDFTRQHRLMDAAYQKEAAIAVATAVQDKPVIKVEYRIDPYEPEPDLSKHPNELYDQIDWSAAMRFRRTANKLMEKIQLGMGLAMVGMLLIAIFLIVGSVQKG